MVYDTQITIVNGIYQPTNITGGPQMSRNPQQKKKQTNKQTWLMRGVAEHFVKG